MKAVIQKVNESKVTVDNKIINEIQKGLCVLIGFEKDDTEEKFLKWQRKLLK